MQTIKKIGTKKTIPQQVYAYLLQMIKAGQFKTGDKFPSEPELASRLGVSAFLYAKLFPDLKQMG